MDNAIKRIAYAVVALLAAAAGWLSYNHALDVVAAYGVPRPDRYVYPATVDGLIFMASLVLLHCARIGLKGHVRAVAWGVAGTGVVITAAANAWAGISHGPLGAFIFAWPAVALVAAYELLMLLIRNAGKPDATPAEVPGVRQLMKEHGVGYPKAKALQASMNGGTK